MNIIVIGGGYWGINHAKELGANLSYIVETNPERSEYIQKNYGFKVVPELDSDFTGAIIATPPDTHVEIALPLLKEGKKVLIEKPMSHNFEECFKLKPYAKNVMIGHIYLYHPKIEELKSRLSDFPLNHIFCRRTNNGPVRTWADSLWDLAPHEISILNYWFEEMPISIASFLDFDYAMVRLGYYAIDALIYVSWRGGPKTRSIELVPFEGERLVFDDVKEVLSISPMRRMLNAFLEESWHDRCSYQHGLDVMKVLEGCNVS